MTHLKVYAWFNPRKNDRREVVAAPSSATARIALGATWIEGPFAQWPSYAFLLAEPGVVFWRTGLDAPWHRAENEPLDGARSSLLGLLTARVANHPDAGLDETERAEVAAMQETIRCAEADEAWHREGEDGAERRAAIVVARTVQRWARGRIAEIRGTEPR